MMLRRASGVVVLALVLTACGGSEEGVVEVGSAGQAATPAAEPTSVPTTETTAPVGGAAEGGVQAAAEHSDSLEGLVPCEHVDGYTIYYPEGWHTNSGEVAPPCTYFHPVAFEVIKNTDAWTFSISVDMSPVHFSQEVTEGSYMPGTLVEEETTVGGRPATRTEAVVGTESLYPQGSPMLSYQVDVSTADQERMLSLFTVGFGGASGDGYIEDFETNSAVLDRMAATLEFDERFGG